MLMLVSFAQSAEAGDVAQLRWRVERKIVVSQAKGQLTASQAMSLKSRVLLAERNSKNAKDFEKELTFIDKQVDRASQQKQVAARLFSWW